MKNQHREQPESGLSAYRAYLVGQDGRIERSVDIAAETDEAAIEQTRGLARTNKVELWDRSRVVVRLPIAAAE